LGLILGNGEIENPHNLWTTNQLCGFISGERGISRRRRGPPLIYHL